jgi:hypothetical protein
MIRKTKDILRDQSKKLDDELLLQLQETTASYGQKEQFFSSTMKASEQGHSLVRTSCEGRKGQ